MYVVNNKNGIAEIIGKAENVVSLVVVDEIPALVERDGYRAVLHYEGGKLVWVYDPYTPKEMREKAYATEKRIAFDGLSISVNEANYLWQIYLAEGSSKADVLQGLIANAKADIRARYPD